MYYLLAIIFLAFGLLLYFHIADYYNIVDRPNERSSHSEITIRGGGIIFLLAACITLCWHFNEFYLLATGVMIIGPISLLDDIYTLSNRVRILFHIIALTLLFLYLGLFVKPLFYLIIALYILGIGIINAYNFMDGINGITGLYSLVILGSLQWVNLKRVPFINSDIIWLPMIACVVFLFFNFRKKAKCFAGDVGSIVIAFWIIAILFRLIFMTGNWGYILFLSVYGIDTGLTIIHRLLLKQNIFKAHRLHLYQILANEHKTSHRLISTGYALVQGIIIFFVINSKISTMYLYMIILPLLILVYISVKIKLYKLHTN